MFKPEGRDVALILAGLGAAALSHTLFSSMSEAQTGIDFWNEKANEMYNTANQIAAGKIENPEFSDLEYLFAGRYALEQRASWKFIQFISGVGGVFSAGAAIGLTVTGIRSSFKQVN